ncbi:methenyltetrahydrofolate synthase domain-containing protein isoform X1 [Amia ocellicauda]|uniref:methenyltetrahydrofolate synthase domain-containing protein isoform X1 n=1 Tax=Amia ocellicauda TaxID=2972642 RepID=UPI003464C87F
MEPAIKLNPGCTKWDIRQKVWDYIEANNLANFPRPVHHRIPNFKGAYAACEHVTNLEVFQNAKEVKVDPDKPLEGARLAALQARKTLLVPTPRLRTGLFNKIVPPQGATKEELRICSTSRGVKEYSVPIGLDASVHVDLVVVGSVAVSEKGYRIGKGEGFADLEYAMMVAMGAVTDSTIIVTIVHDCQIVNIPEELIESHDLTVDYILTPTRVIKTDCTCPKPQGILWTKCDVDTLEKIPILKKLCRMEEEAGKDVALKKELPRGDPSQAAAREPGKRDGEPERGGGSVPASVSEVPRQGRITTVYMGGIPAGLRVSELKGVLRERGALPLRLNWQGAQHRAFLDYTDLHSAEEALAALQGLILSGNSVCAELARSQRGDRNAGRAPRRPKVTKAAESGAQDQSAP